MLRRQGYTAFLVGGCVRDLLLGREPADYDVATSATPDDVMRLFPQTYAVGAQFGVVLVPVRHDTPEGERDNDNYAVEVATFRSDGLYSDGRHPDEVLPEIQRMQGVQQPPQFHPEGDVWVHTLLLLEGLEAGCSTTLALGVLLHDVGKPPTFRVAPDRIRFDQHAEVGTRMALDICRRFRLSNGETDQVCALVANHMRFGDVQKMKESTLKRFLRLQQFDEHMALHRLDCLASHRDLSLYEFAQERLQKTPEEQIRPRPLITGDDLIAAGFLPGPLFKDLLLAVEDAQLE